MSNKFDTSDIRADSTVDILDVAVEVLGEYCGEGNQRIVRMARWIVGNLGVQNFGMGPVYVGVSRPDGNKARRVMVCITDDLTPEQARHAAAAMFTSADQAESVH